MELSAEEFEKVKELSREIDFGRITVSFVGKPSNLVDIVGEKHFRFHHEKAEPTTGEPVERTGRYDPAKK